MCTRAKRWRTALTVVVALMLACVSVAGASQTEDLRVLDLFEQGMTYYRTGEYEHARRTFDRLLALEPGMQAALRMREEADLGLMFEMKQRDELGPQAEKLIDLIMRAGREARRDVQDPDELIRMLTSEDVREYGEAQVALKGHGPYAVPYVLPLLQETDPEKQHLVGRAVGLLGTMQRDATLPLVVAMSNTDDTLLQRRIAGVLGQLSDPRALPALMGLWEQTEPEEPARRAAAEAIRKIAEVAPEALESAVTQYVEIGLAYFFEEQVRVGFTFGTSADVWHWNPAGRTLPQMLRYQEVPNYLYYQRMATETALEGLAIAPDNARLRGLLGAALVRQKALTEYFKTAEFRFGGRDLTEQVQQEAARRAEAFAVQVPFVLSMLDVPMVARSLDLALDAGDGPASLYLVRMLGAKLTATHQAPLPSVADALVAGLKSGDRDVRYNSAIVLVESCPLGVSGPPDQIIEVLNAALRAATQRRALIIINDFQTRNSLTTILRDGGVGTVETRVHDGSIEAALHLEPSVDAIFLSGNVPDLLFGRIIELLKADPRTKDLPLYVVTGPADPAAEVGDYDEIDRVLTTDDIRREKLEPIIEDVLAVSRTVFTEEEEQIVLKAVKALDRVDPDTTEYPLGRLEPALIQALRGYREQVTAAAIGALASFGTGESLGPLGRVVAEGDTVELQAAACRAMAAIMVRTGAQPPQRAHEALMAALASEHEFLRQAAAEALGAAGLEAETEMSLIRTEGLGLD